MQYSLSIVIPTYHRKKSLFALLTNLAKSVKFAGDIVVVEQGERNATELVTLSKKLSLKISYVHMKHASTSRAMNLGVKHASGEYVLFLDDDVLGTEGFITQHLSNFEDQDVGATVGRCVTNGQKIETDCTKTGRINWLGGFSDGFSSTVRQEVDTVIGCNACFRKEIYLKVGGIDERFTGNALRLESDLSLRIKQLGYKIIFDPLAEVQHLREPSGGARKTEGRMRWYHDFFSNETYFFRKHRPTVLFPLFLMTKIPWALKCMFGFGREVSIRSLVTPLNGVLDGIRKYQMFQKLKQGQTRLTGI